MRLGIIPFHASLNYGSNLQAWALQTYLERKGHQVEIINYRSPYQKSMYFKTFDFSERFWYRYSLPVSFKRLLLYPSSIIPARRKWDLFEDFINNELHLTKEYHSEVQLKNAGFDFDLAITGSDQVWITTKEAGDMFFLDFLDKRITKISYAPSLGPYPEKISVNYLKSNLVEFTGVSVREEKAKEYLIKNGIVDDCKVVCDPTLLLDTEDYLSLVDAEPLIKEPYVFFYSPSSITDTHFKIAHHLGKKYGLKVITSDVYYPKDIKKYGNISNKIDVGPKEFLNLVKNAQYTVGASFHLLLFSILFEKQFYCINGDVDSRMKNILHKLNLQGRAISCSAPPVFDDTPISNYEHIADKLRELRKDSVDYLSEYIQ